MNIGEIGTYAAAIFLLIGALFTLVGSSIHELLIMAFLFVTAPISANFISKVHIHLRCTEKTPELEDDQTWSTLVRREEDFGNKK